MRNANLVANELHNVGFRTKANLSNVVEVSLTNRKPSQMEVKIALDQLFEGIDFELTSTSDSIIVSF